MNRKNTALRVVASVASTLLLCLVILAIIFFGKDNGRSNSFDRNDENNNLPHTGKNYFLEDNLKIQIPNKRNFIIQIPFGKVNILKTEEREPYIEISGESDFFTENLYFNVTEPKLDECKIEFDFKDFNFGFLGNFNFDAFKPSINIYLPNNLDKLDVSLDAGALKVSKLKAERFILSVDAGDGKVYGCDFEKINTNVDAGNLEMEIGDANSVSADVDVGNLKMYIPKDTKGFLVNYKTELGNFSDKTELDVNQDIFKRENSFQLDKSGSIEYGKGDDIVKIDVSVDVGNVSLYTY